MTEEDFKSEIEEYEFHSASGNLMETKVSHLDDILNEKLESAFQQSSFQELLHDVGKISCEYSPIDLAHAVMRLPGNSRPIVYENLPNFEAKITFIVNTDSTTRTAILRYLDFKEIKKLIESMPLSEAVWVLDDISDRRLRSVLELVDLDTSRKINELRNHDRNSAKRLMTNQFFAFTMDTKIGEAALHIRNNPTIELTRSIFVINKVGELQGFVPARNLIVNLPELPLKQVMQPVMYKVSPEASREEVVDLVERYKISAVPVINSENFLEGVITYEDVVEVMEDITDETIARIAGTDEEDTAYEPIYRKFLSRLPWLLVTLCAGMLNMANMSYFESIEGPWFLFIFFFVPLITGMSGNVGLQCSTILVRGMATGELSAGARGQVVGKELLTGLSIGCAFGFLSALLIQLIAILGLHTFGADPLSIGIIVGAGLFGACLTATILGIISPLGFAKLGIDPAVASGPIVTAFNDVLSTIMYFIIARLLSGILLFDKL